MHPVKPVKLLLFRKPGCRAATCRLLSDHLPEYENSYFYMMKLPVVSVITPTFNAASTVERTLLSVLGQRYKAVEHIFVDGLSEDSTLSIIPSHDTDRTPQAVHLMR